MSAQEEQIDILQEYSTADLPPIDESEFNDRRERFPINEDEDFVAGVGDVIIRDRFNRDPEYRYVLHGMEATGLVVYVLNEKRYTYYPGDYISEDAMEGKLTLVEDPWDLR